MSETFNKIKFGNRTFDLPTYEFNTEYNAITNKAATMKDINNSFPLNLLNYPYAFTKYYGYSFEQNGLMVDANSDGITLNGTSSSVGYEILMLQFNMPLDNDIYTFELNPSSEIDSVCLTVALAKTSGSERKTIYNSLVIDNSTGQYTEISRCYLLISTTGEFDNFKIRPAIYKSDTELPYNAWIGNGDTPANAIGKSFDHLIKTKMDMAVNLLRFPYVDTDKTVNNVTFKVYDDGSIGVKTTVDGASADSVFYLQRFSNKSLNINMNEPFSISLETSLGDSSNNVYLQVWGWDAINVQHWYHTTDRENGTVIPANGLDISKDHNVVIVIKNNSVYLDEFIIRPMLSIGPEPIKYSRYIGEGRNIYDILGNLLSDKIDIKSINLTGTTANMLSLVQSLGVNNIHYARWFSASDGGAANISGLPITGKCFVCEAICMRRISTTDYRYHLTCYIENTAEPYVAVIRATTTEIGWHLVSLKEDLPSKLSDLTDDILSGKYLPLTGGTILGDGTPLTINRKVDNTDVNYAKFQSITPTASAHGFGRLLLGNATACARDATNKGAYGTLAIYGTGTGYLNLRNYNNHTDSYIVDLPSKAGTLALTDDTLLGHIQKINQPAETDPRIDLNNFIDTGHFDFTVQTVRSYMDNKPENIADAAGFLTVYRWSNNSNYILQIFETLASSKDRIQRFQRCRYNGAWTAWVEFANEDDIPSKLSELTDDIGIANTQAKVNNIGNLTTNNGSAKTLAKSVGQSLASFTLTGGHTYIVICSVKIAKGTVGGDRRIQFSSTSDQIAGQLLYTDDFKSSSDSYTYRTFSTFITPTTDTTYHLNAWQDSDTSLAASGYMRAIKIT